ncbi:MAG: 2Fe-2S iron-sulfur cluster-binding protein [Ilumatobacteraceae bacterium]
MPEIAVVGGGRIGVAADDGTVADRRRAVGRRPDDRRSTSRRSPDDPSTTSCSPTWLLAAADRATPISDLVASDRYRRHTVGVMARRAVEAAARRAGGETIAVPVNRALDRSFTSASAEQYVLTVNGVDYPIIADASRTSWRDPHRGRTHRHEGRLRRFVSAAPAWCSSTAGRSTRARTSPQAQGRSVTTVESLADGDELSDLQRDLLEVGGVQCGFCTPGMLMSATALLAEQPDPTDDEIRIGLSGNLCRCTGYARIIDAVKVTARRR